MRLTLATALLAMATPVLAALDYRVHLQTGTARLAVDVCSDRDRERISLQRSRGLPSTVLPVLAMRGGSVDRQPGRVVIEGRHIHLNDVLAGDCLRYQVDLAAGIAAGGREIGSVVGQRTWLIVPALWLWRPLGRETISLTLDLPAGVSASLPWSPDASGIYHPPVDGSGWSASTAFGQLQQREIRRDGRRLRVAALAPDSVAQGERFLDWVEQAVDATRQAFGQLPLPDAQVLIVPVRFGRSAVPFGETLRGEAASVRLLARHDAAPDELSDDWTAVHELSHLFHPYLGDSGRWLSEGIASYYQNVLRSRGGLLTEESAWRRLDAGFQRGERDRHNAPLSEVSRNMPRLNAFMRTYWSGAAMMLEADLALRRRGSSLDAVLSKFNACCLPATQRWQPEAFVSRLDQLVGEPVFVPLFRRYAASSEFPDLSASYHTLGIKRRGRQLTFSDHPAEKALRQAIMRPALPDAVTANP